MRNNKLIIFYSFVTFALMTILFTTPFLRYPYDMFHHLIVIDKLYMQLTHPVQKCIGIWANDLYFMIPTGEYEEIVLPRARYIWHFSWALLFNVFNIDSTQMFLRAKIIHIIQIYISLFSLYYFSNVVMRNIFKKIDKLTLKWLSFWSVIIWFTVYATFSAAYHQVWMMWYSVNYQITLPLFWYMTALTLMLLLEKTSLLKKIFFVLQILLLSRFILQAHSMEFLYYLMYLSAFSLVFMDKLYLVLKKYFYILIPLILAIVYFIKHYQPDHSKILNYMSVEKLPQLYSKIMHEGSVLLHGYNRSSASINELMYFIGLISIVLIASLIWSNLKNQNTNINTRMIIFILLTSLFVFIPVNQFLGGLFGMITHTMVVNRLYYSSSLFVLFPIIVYYFSNRYHLKLKYIHLIILASLLSVFVYSKYTNTLTHNYYKNILSIKNSFHERKVGFNLAKIQIEHIGAQLKEYETKNLTAKKIKYYARADIAFVIKYIYHKEVYWKGRRANPNYIKVYEKDKNIKDYNKILFEIPKDFPPYHPYM